MPFTPWLTALSRMKDGYVISVKDFCENEYIQFYTAMGMVKRTQLSEYNARKTKIQACSLKNDDRIVGAELTRGEKDIILVTSKGMSIRFDGSEVPVVGRVAMGVRAIRLKKNDRVIFGCDADDEGEIVTVTNRGFIKRTLAADYQPGKGGWFQNHPVSGINQNGSCLAAFYVKDPRNCIAAEGWDNNQDRN